jgi:CheY-like chemotaxis protein
MQNQQPPSPKSSKAAESKSTKTTSGLRILLAEDEPAIRAIAVMSLSKVGGHTVTTAENGRQALDIAAAQPFDLILLDVMMPELDGFETCARLKSNPVTDHIPIIFLTAKAQTREQQHGLSLGAHGYIVKPFDPMTLSDQIKDILQSQVSDPHGNA